MSRRRGLWRLTAAATAVVSASALSIGIAGGSPSHASAHHPQARPDSARHARQHLRRLLTPAKKYYGVYVSQAPASMQPIDRVTQQTGKHPNMSLFYGAWGDSAAQGYSNINVDAIDNACNAGMLPMLTWESWNTSVSGPNGPAWAQPDFAPDLIAQGKYDAYIRASAETIKRLNCPIALRLDQEDNGYWYPWGIATQGMRNSAADYVAMWRHVWKIFNHVGARNVLWVWSPNVQGYKHRGLPSLHASYPGGRYVDWIGVDGYIYGNPNQNFHDRFQPTFDQLRAFVPDTPWIVAECGVGDAASKPRQLRNLVQAVARRKRLTGLNYFDDNKSTSAANWMFDDTQASLNAFKRAINSGAYGAARPGHTPAG